LITFENHKKNKMMYYMIYNYKQSAYYLRKGGPIIIP